MSHLAYFAYPTRKTHIYPRKGLQNTSPEFMVLKTTIKIAVFLQLYGKLCHLLYYSIVALSSSNTTKAVTSYISMIQGVIVARVYQTLY